MSPALRPTTARPPVENQPPPPPVGLRWRSSTWFIVSTVGMGIFTDMVLYCLIVPVLPFMLQDRIHLPDDQIQSQVSNLLAVYAAASVISSPITGLLADKWGTRQLPFLLGLSALLIATFLLALGQTVLALIVARALQGLSAAVVWVVGLALLVETVGSDRMGAVIGSIYSLMTVGGLISPVLGGILYRKTGYTGVFGVSIAIVIMDLIMRLLVIERKVALQHEQQSVSKLQYGHDRPSPETAPFPSNDTNENTPLLGQRRPAGDPRYRLSSKHTSKKSFLARHVPILVLLPHPRMLTSLLVGFIQALLFGTFDSTLPVAAKETYGFNSLRAGLLFLALGTFDLFIGPLAGWAADRFSPRAVAVVGYAWLAPVLTLFRLLAVPSNDAGVDTSREIALFCLLLSLCGIGIAIVNAPSLVEAGLIVDAYHRANPELFGERGPYAQLYGLNGMIWNLGLAVGPLVAGALKTWLGFGNMLAVMAALCAGTAVLAFVFMGRKGDDEVFEEAGDA
ncbi:major facilitator superfamily domain-containing protein [Macrophomina phaseolina]|uniref:Major facilitator superfamily domain-containing protein n=1 Tax=Macrophomina phaseolina TaxID=35725 RepID=A0ABQ8GT21_9PEZI|nr:major facilitator superfamily domain-containing protein [Macrophomina phaseolina]